MGTHWSFVRNLHNPRWNGYPGSAMYPLTTSMLPPILHILGVAGSWWAFAYPSLSLAECWLTVQPE